MQPLAPAVRFVVAVVLLTAGFTKLIAPQQSSLVLRAVLLPQRIVKTLNSRSYSQQLVINTASGLLTYTIVATEYLLGIGLLATHGSANRLFILASTSFLVAVTPIAIFARARRLNCGCFGVGTYGHLPSMRLLLLRSAFFLALAILTFLLPAPAFLMASSLARIGLTLGALLSSVLFTGGIQQHLRSPNRKSQPSSLPPSVAPQLTSRRNFLKLGAAAAAFPIVTQLTNGLVPKRAPGPYQVLRRHPS